MENDPTSGLMSLVADAAFVLEGAYVCHECKKVTPVFALLLQGPFQATGDVYLDDEDETALLRNPVDLPEILAKSIETLSDGAFRKDFSLTVQQKYWMNHCNACGTKIGDWYVSRPGEAFFPTTDEEILSLTGQRFAGPFSFDDPNLSMSSWTSLWINTVVGSH
jgi:hypothetical protein